MTVEKYGLPILQRSLARRHGLPKIADPLSGPNIDIAKRILYDCEVGNWSEIALVCRRWHRLVTETRIDKAYFYLTALPLKNQYDKIPKSLPDQEIDQYIRRCIDWLKTIRTGKLKIAKQKCKLSIPPLVNIVFSELPPFRGLESLKKRTYRELSLSGDCDPLIYDHCLSFIKGGYLKEAYEIANLARERVFIYEKMAEALSKKKDFIRAVAIADLLWESGAETSQLYFTIAMDMKNEKQIEEATLQITKISSIYLRSLALQSILIDPTI